MRLHVLEAVSEVTGVVGDHHDLDQLDAETGQLLGKPGTVAVRDGRRQHLGAGHQDPGPHLTAGAAARPEYLLA